MFDWLDILAKRWLSWRTDRAIKNDPELAARYVKIEAKPGSIDIDFVSPDVAIIAGYFAEMLDKAHADNYVQFDMIPKIGRDIKPVRVTVQWANGESPAEQNARLRNEIEQLKQKTV